jgi:hypothetical protein
VGLSSQAVSAQVNGLEEGKGRQKSDRKEEIVGLNHAERNELKVYRIMNPAPKNLCRENLLPKN